MKPLRGAGDSVSRALYFSIFNRASASQLRRGKRIDPGVSFRDAQFAAFEQISCLFNALKISRVEKLPGILHLGYVYRAI
jgi:hypothetical protein